MWQYAIILVLLAGMVALHLWWRRRYDKGGAAARARLVELNSQQRAADSREQAKIDALFDSMVEGLLILDSGGRVQTYNRSFRQMFDVKGDITGKSILEAVRLHELAEIASRLTTEPHVTGREIRLNAGGMDRFVEVNAAAVADSSSGQRGAILVFHDLTRVKQLERTSSEFVANVSHELRTPLSMIKGYSETLLAGAKDDPELATKFLQTIERHSNRLALLIEDLLTSSKLESGVAIMDFQPVALRELVDKVLTDFESRARARKMTLMNHVPGLIVRADANRLEQVFANLVDNAVKYGREAGNVIASGRALENGRIEIQVKDDGPGLPSESAHRVFERFYRVDKGRSRDQGGTGLGLAIVKDIVQAHSGKVWVESQLGQGTTFYFTLPMAGSENEQRPLL